MKKNFLKIISVSILLLIVSIGCKKDQNVTHVTLDKAEITIVVGEVATIVATVYPEDAKNKTVSWTSNNTDIAMVANGIITAIGVGTATISVITEDGNYMAKCTVMVVPTKWVEINGIKWAKFNVDMPGTFAAHPEDAGMFYQWNKKVGWSATDPIINSNGGTLWDTSEAEGDTWEKANDPCPKGWRVPTHEELVSLANADNQWTNLNGEYGCKFDGAGESLFLPAAMFRDYADGSFSWYPTLLQGIYWSSSSNATCVSALSISSVEVRVGDVCFSRAYGFSVRCVAE
jgi:uncharacterized protein (TIGR02145 family)